MLGIFADVMRQSTLSRRADRDGPQTDPHERRLPGWSAPDHWIRDPWAPRYLQDREGNR